MKKIIFCALIYLCLASCIRNHENPNLIQVDAKFFDLKGNPMNEAQSGVTLIISSDDFAKLAPGGLSPNIAKLYFDDVPADFQQISPNSISTRIPIMLYSDYAQLRINFRINQIAFKIQVIQVLNYRPTVTAEVLAGNDGTFQMPAEMTIDALGNLYVIDQRTGPHDVIVKVAPDGTTSLFAGGKDEFGRLVGLGIDATTSRMYVSDATAQQVKWFDMSSTGIINVLAGSGTAGNVEGTGTGASFRFGGQRVDDFGGNEKGQGLVVDGSGNVYVGEQFGTLYSGSESQVRKITPAGVTSTIPGSQIVLSAGPDDFHPVSGLTLLASNEVVYTGGASSFFQGVTKINADATRTRIAGKVSFENLNDGTGPSAEFAYPKAIKFYNPYYHVADGTNGAYRRAYSSGKVITIAGVGHMNTPSFCFCGITGPTDASYLFPSIFDANPNKFEEAASAIIMDQVGGIAVKSNSLVYLSDYGTNFKCIWKIRIE